MAGQIDRIIAKLDDKYNALTAAQLATPQALELNTLIAKLNRAANDSNADQIVANLPSDANGKKIKAMLQRMADDATGIGMSEDNLARVVDIANGLLTIVTSAGTNPVAAGQAAGNIMSRLTT